MNVTNCTRCGKLYEAWSEEAANEPSRLCGDCAPMADRELERPFGGPPCPHTGVPRDFCTCAAHAWRGAE